MTPEVHTVSAAVRFDTTRHQLLDFPFFPLLASSTSGLAAGLLEHIANVEQRGEEAPASNEEVEKMLS